MQINNLEGISPLDGRYADKVDQLRPIVSEFGLIKYRVAVEIEWLRTLAGGLLPDLEPLSQKADKDLVVIAKRFSIADAEKIKEIEATTKHDVKAVEIWLRGEMAKDSEFDNHLEFIHFGCTSDDINNLAYAMMLRDARDHIIVPAIDLIGIDLESKAHEYADIALLAKTHGQPATPTTLGKEMAVYVDRLSGTVKSLKDIVVYGKFNGATGNYSAVTYAYPELDWIEISKQFVERLGFTYKERTTQIEPHDWTARFCNELAIANTIMTDLARDMWLYIADGVFKQVVVKGEVGSSTMPHKVNPIDFENAEGNFGISNALLTHFAAKLPISRLQRDLSDSSAQRGLGTALGHAVVALGSLLRGLGKVAPNTSVITAALDAEWAILTEPLQTVMRKNGVENAYGIIKNLSRGQPFSKELYIKIINGLEIKLEDKDRLLRLTPNTYIGKAVELATSVQYQRGQ